jgi:hypothetical protein
MIKNLEYQVMHIDFNIYRVEQRSKINAPVTFFPQRLIIQQNVRHDYISEICSLEINQPTLE